LINTLKVRFAPREKLFVQNQIEGGYPLDLQEDSQSYTEWAGYHGTSLQSAEQIVVSNYRISEADNDWLGNGAYFFIDGFADPVENAVNWARFRSRTGTRKRKRTIAMLC
jgi:hypothetical protein